MITMEEVLRHYEKTAPDRRRLILARRIVESKWELEEIVTRGEDTVIFIVLDGSHISRVLKLILI